MLIKIIKNKQVTVHTKDKLIIQGFILQVDKESNLLMKDVSINKKDHLDKFSIRGSDICYIVY
jgi:small nuclear ribonucleoprotein (snRNP)-like protein